MSEIVLFKFMLWKFKVLSVFTVFCETEKNFRDAILLILLNKSKIKIFIVDL